MPLHLYIRQDSQETTSSKYDAWLREVQKRDRKAAFAAGCAMIAVVGAAVYVMLQALPIGWGV